MLLFCVGSVLLVWMRNYGDVGRGVRGGSELKHIRITLFCFVAGTEKPLRALLARY